MRNLVQPPPSMHCELCHGELRLRLIEPDDSVLDMEVHNFVCAKCGCGYSYMVIHDRYTARTTRNMSGAR